LPNAVSFLPVVKSSFRWSALVFLMSSDTAVVVMGVPR